nr:DNA repair protein RadA [Ipomoea batatas]
MLDYSFSLFTYHSKMMTSNKYTEIMQMKYFMFLLMQVLTKQAGLKLQGIFLNVISGFKLTETAGDLAMAAASCRIHKTQVEIWDLHIL